ncbi:MAG: copper(I)-binding protein [Oleispira sp.]
MKYNHQSASFLIIFSAFFLSSSVFAELLVEEGYVRKPIPGRSMSAAFMTINNTGAADVVLKTVEIEGTQNVEIHTHTHKKGIMRMRQLHELVIKAESAVVLAPGGLHLMMFGIEHLPENPQLTLCDELNNCSIFSLSVRNLVPQP